MKIRLGSLLATALILSQPAYARIKIFGKKKTPSSIITKIANERDYPFSVYTQKKDGKKIFSATIKGQKELSPKDCKITKSIALFLMPTSSTNSKNNHGYKIWDAGKGSIAWRMVDQQGVDINDRSWSGTSFYTKTKKSKELIVTIPKYSGLLKFSQP